MAQRPIMWALGTALSVGIGALHSGVELAQSVAGIPDKSLAANTIQPVAQAPRGPAVMAVSADGQGHYTVYPSIANISIRMLVDTGASIVALTERDAAVLGIRPSPADYTMTLRTANGSVRGARATLREVRLGGILVRDVEAVVMPPGALSVSLLGTSFLRKLQGYEVQGGRMLLKG